jgi:hypothetical protein
MHIHPSLIGRLAADRERAAAALRHARPSAYVRPGASFRSPRRCCGGRRRDRYGRLPEREKITFPGMGPGLHVMVHLGLGSPTTLTAGVCLHNRVHGRLIESWILAMFVGC